MTQASNVLVNFRQKYKNTQFIIQEFDKPLFENRFFINKNGLIYNSKSVPNFQNIWVQNPQRFALDYYGDYDFYRIILLVNDINSVFRFDLNNLKNGVIIAPSKTAILQTIME